MRFKQIHIGPFKIPIFKGVSVSHAATIGGAAKFLLVALGLATALVAVLEGLGYLVLSYEMAMIDRALPRLFRLHMISSGIALALIPIVIYLRRNIAWHRPLGWMTVVATVIGGITALPVSFASSSPVMARAGLFVQGVVWLALVVFGVWSIRTGKRGQHAHCMAAMAAVASGALWLRIGTATASTWEVPFDEVYVVLCWVAWILPALLVAYLARHGRLRML